MTTIIEPAGSPTIIFRSNDPVVYTVEATGSDDTDAADLTVYTTRTYAFVDSDDSAKGIKLPASAEIGDRLDILGLPGGSGFKIYSPAGALLTTSGTSPRWIFAPHGWNQY